MSTTANYNLPLTDDSSTKFLDWRNEINGTSDSAMIKIDNALSGKANCSQVVSATLYAESWTASGSAYTQDITVEGLTSDGNGVISISQNLTTEQLQAVQNAWFYVSKQSDGVLTISLSGEVPSCDIPVFIIMLG